MPDSKWLDALKLPLRIMCGISLGTGLMLGLNAYRVVELDVFGPYARTVVALIFIASSALAATGLVGFLYDLRMKRNQAKALAARRAASKVEAERLLHEQQNAAVQRLDFLTAGELRLLAGCLKTNSQSFTTWVHDSHVAMLQAKGIVSTPGGHHLTDHYPYVIVDHVWQAMLPRKEALLAQDEEYLREKAKKSGR